MALFVDGPASSVDDLRDQDAGLLDVALTCDINVTTKLRLAHEEIESELALWLLKARPTFYVPGFPGIRIEQVVVTPTLRRWEAMHALTLVYRDAYFTQLVDRYQSKWQEYGKLARDVRETFVSTGMGIVTDPLPVANAPLLSSSAAPQTGGTFYASVAWINAAGQEGCASVASSLVVPDAHLMVVNALSAPANAVGYRVYAGASLDALLQQNPVPLPVGTAFRFVPGLVTSGRMQGSGQVPDFVRPMPRTWLRG
jgi:hypothetical protein